MGIQEKIQIGYPAFSAKEKKIAAFLLSNGETIANINISELAELTESSPATITRFARKLDCQSFVDMKMQLNAGEFTAQKNESASIKNDVYNFYSRVIKKTEEITDYEVLKAFIDLIEKAQRIFVFGVGSSGLTALEFTQRLLRMGLSAYGSSDSHMMVIHSSIVKENDLVIGISASGTTKEVIDSLTLAKKNGATTASITCFPESKAAQIADLTLNAYSSLFISEKRFVNSQFSIMYQIDILSTMLLENEELDKKMSRTITAINQNED